LKTSSHFILASFLAAMLALSACGGGGANTNSNTTSSEPAVTTSSTSQTTTSSQPASSAATTTAVQTTTSATSSTPVSTGFLPVTTAGTASPSNGQRIMFDDTDPGKQPATKVPHPVDGAFSNCLACHYGDSAIGSQFAVTVQHPCDECHAVAPSIAFDPGHYMGQAPTQPMEQSCILCHTAA
jgi:hypothetical protein